MKQQEYAHTYETTGIRALVLNPKIPKFPKLGLFHRSGKNQGYCIDCQIKRFNKLHWMRLIWSGFSSPGSSQSNFCWNFDRIRSSYLLPLRFASKNSRCFEGCWFHGGGARYYRSPREVDSTAANEFKSRETVFKSRDSNICSCSSSGGSFSS